MSTHAPTAPLLLHHRLALFLVPSVPCWWHMVIFSCYVTVAMHYSEGAHYYSDIAAASQFVPADTVTVVCHYVTVASCVDAPKLT